MLRLEETAAAVECWHQRDALGSVTRIDSTWSTPTLSGISYRSTKDFGLAMSGDIVPTFGNIW